MIPTRRALLAGAGAAVLAAAGGAAGWWAHRRNSLHVPRSLLIAGSGSMHALNQALAKHFATLHPQVMLVVEAGGSTAGLLALRHGAIDVAAMSRDLTEEEDTAHARGHLIAINDIGIVVHPASPVAGLARAQLRAIFNGQISNWRAVGGPDAPIKVLTRDRGVPSLRFVEDEILKGDEMAVNARAFAQAQQLADAVAADRHAIGFLALSEQAAGAVRPLAIDGVLPGRAQVLSGRYGLTQPFYLVLHGEPPAAARDFVEFARSAQGQEIVHQLGLVAVG